MAALILLPVAAPAQDVEEDKGFLVNLIEENLSGDQRKVDIQGFAGALSSQATLEQLTVADSDGVWLTLENVTLDWNRAALLRGAISVETLSAKRIVVARAPLPDTSLPPAEAQPFSLPDLPVSIQLNQLQVDRIELGPAFLGESLALGLSGSAALAGGEGAANITAARQDGKQGSYVIDGSYANATSLLDLTLSIAEAPDGVAARLLDLPGRPSVALDVTGNGPLSDFAATLALATDGQDRVNGTFTLQAVDEEQNFVLDINGDIAPLLPAAYRDFFGDQVALVAAGSGGDNGFSLERLDLRTRSLTLTGAARIDADGWPARLSLNGTIADGTGAAVLLPLGGAETFVDSVGLDISYDRAVSDDWTARFDINGLDRPGLLVRNITLNGGGQIVAGTGAAVGEVTANMTYAATGLELDDVGAAQAFGDAINGVFELGYTEGRPTRISRLTLAGPGIGLLADATIDGADNGFETQANLVFSAEALARFATLAGQPALAGAADLNLIATLRPLDRQFDLLLNGTTQDLAVGLPQLDALLQGAGETSLRAARDTQGTRVDGLRIATAEANVTANINLTSANSDADFNIGIRDVGLVLEGVSGPATLSGTANRSANGTTSFDVAGRAPEADLAANGVVVEGNAGATITGRVTANVADIRRYQRIADRPLSGGLTLDAKGSARTDLALFDVDLTATMRDLVTGIARLDPLLTGAGEVALKASNANGNYILESLRLVTPQASVTANGRHDDAGAQGVFDVAISDLGLILPDISGPVSLKGTADRTRAGVTTFDVTGTAPAATLAADGTLTETDAAPVIAGNLTALVTDLSLYRAMAGRPLAGAIDLKATGHGRTDGSLFDLDLTARSRDLGLGIAQLDPLLRGNGELQTTALRTGTAAFRLDGLTLKTPAIDLNASGTGALTGPAEVQLDLTLANAGDAFRGLNGPLTLRVAGNRGVDDVGRLTLNANGSGTIVDLNATVAPPADGYRISGNLSANIDNLAPFAGLAGLPLSGGLSAEITGNALPDLSQISADVGLRSRSLAIGNPQVDQLLAGAGQLTATISRDGENIVIPGFSAQTRQVSASGSLSTDGSTGQANFDARLADIGLFTDQLSGPVTANGSAALNASNAWALDVNATGPGGIAATANGTIAAGGNLNLALRGTVPLGLANTVLDPRRIDGSALIDLNINGPAALSSVSGQISTSGARLADPGLAQALENISGNITLNGGAATIALSADVQSGGQLRINGPVTLTAPFNADLAVTLDQVILRDPNLYQTSINGTISANGPLGGGARIAGVLTLGQTDVQVPSSGIGALGALPEVTHIGADQGVQQTLNRAGLTAQPQPATAGGGGPAYPLDITINAPSRIFIRGRGLDAELGGTLQIGGTTATIVPVGQFELVRGRIDILQQRFDLNEGTASLQGDFIPVIRLVATTESGTGTVIQIVVAGPATEPVVTFKSTPDLPQDEVLAQLIFGRNLSEISPLQAVQLAAAVGTLAGRGGGGIIDNFRQGIGLDDFDVTTDEDGNAAVRAGAYLSENIYTDVTINSEGQTEINLNLDITSEITAKGTAGADGETGIGIFFERDY